MELIFRYASSGDEKRQVQVIDAGPAGFTGYCRLREARRMFKWDSISEAIDAETGEIHTGRALRSLITTS